MNGIQIGFVIHLKFRCPRNVSRCRVRSRVPVGHFQELDRAIPRMADENARFAHLSSHFRAIPI